MRASLRIGLPLLAVVAAVAVVLWRRARQTPAPAAGLPDRAAPAPTAAGPEDLAEVKGIGPVYRARLAEAGITTFARLAATDPAAVVEATGAAPGRAADWIAQAVALAAR